MKILLDECLPKDLKSVFPDHEVKTVKEMKWNGNKNDELLSLTTKSDFEVFYYY
jgi:predicted nuclease of predicted toxin-antitoxin system